MEQEAVDRERVAEHIRQVSEVLGHPKLKRHVKRAARQVPGQGSRHDRISGLLDTDVGKTESSGGAAHPGVPYMSRAPLVSLLQSHVDVSVRTKNVPPPPGARGFLRQVTRKVSTLLHLRPGTLLPDDPEWYVYIAIAMLGHLARGNHRFNQRPAEVDISDNARIVVVGDWGTGLPGARNVAEHMGDAISDALDQGRQVHVVHLGDVYYSGLSLEYRRRFLKYWPVSTAQAAAGVTSWSCNGNHDMYSGGYGYFKTLLGDPRFKAQRSPDNKPTSYFRLRSSSWNFVGLDTSWDPDVVSHGQSGVLEDPQAQYVADTAADTTRKLAMFSHHQLISVYEKEDVHALPGKLAGVLDRNVITAWWWGHEHRAIAYARARGVKYPRCLGNGGVPVPPDPPPPSGAEITWRSTRTVEGDGSVLTRSGFAVLDLSGDRIEVSYRDDDGHESFRETVS